MAKEGLDPTKEMDAVKFANKIASTATAKDIITSAIARYWEIKRETDRAKERDPSKIDEQTGRSLQVVKAGLQSQVEGVLGQTVQALSPILIPAMKEAGGYLSQLSENIHKATTETDPDKRKAAQSVVEDTAQKMLTGVGAVALTKGIVGQAVAAIAAPMGITAGLTGAVGAKDETTRSLALAGVSLNTAGQSLQAAAVPLGAFGAVVAGLGARLGIAGLATTTGAVVLGATAESAGPGSPGYEYGQMNEKARQLARDQASVGKELYDKRSELKNLIAEHSKAYDKRGGPRSDEQIDKVNNEFRQKSTLLGQEVEALTKKYQSMGDDIKGVASTKDPVMAKFWDWLSEQNKKGAANAQEAVKQAVSSVWTPQGAFQDLKKVPTRAEIKRAGAQAEKAIKAEKERTGWKTFEPPKGIIHFVPKDVDNVKGTGGFTPKGPVKFNTGGQPLNIDANTGMVNITPGGGLTTPGGTPITTPPAKVAEAAVAATPGDTMMTAAAKMETSASTFESVFNSGPQKLAEAGTTAGTNAAASFGGGAAGWGATMAAAFRSGVAGITIGVGPMPAGAKPTDSGTQAA